MITPFFYPSPILFVLNLSPYFTDICQSPTFVTPDLPLHDEHKQDIATPRSLIWKVRVTRPSQYLLPPYSTLQPSEDDEAVYNEVIKHTTDSNSKIKEYETIFLFLYTLTV